MWHGATVRSAIARGHIRSITFSPDVDWSQFTIVTAADIPGENTIVHLTKDHPCLADKQVNHPEEPILLLAHPEKAALLAAARGVHIEYDELPGVFTIEESEAAVAANDANRIIWEGSDSGGTANCFKQYLMYSGEAKDTEAGLAAAFESADFIVEGEYHTGAQEQLYIENNGVIAECFRDATGNDRIRLRARLACSVPTTSCTRSRWSSICRKKSAASSRRRPAVPSAARKTSPPSSARTPRCSR